MSRTDSTHLLTGATAQAPCVLMKSCPLPPARRFKVGVLTLCAVLSLGACSGTSPEQGAEQVVQQAQTEVFRAQVLVMRREVQTLAAFDPTLTDSALAGVFRQPEIAATYNVRVGVTGSTVTVSQGSCTAVLRTEGREITIDSVTCA